MSLKSSFALESGCIYSRPADLVLKPVGFFDRNRALDAPERRATPCHFGSDAGGSSCH